MPLSAAAEGAWGSHDYVSLGLRVVDADAAFPHVHPRDASNHPWKYLRREVPHRWYASELDPTLGLLNRDEATVLHNLALQFAGRRALEIGSWIGWSTCHIALAGVTVDAVDPAYGDARIANAAHASAAAAGVGDRVRFVSGSSPGALGELAADGTKWSLFFVDGDHEGIAPVRDVRACLPHATWDCAFVLHDLSSPDVAAALLALRSEGFEIAIYHTAQVMGLAWRGDVTPVAHLPDPAVPWQVPPHLHGVPTVGVDFQPRRAHPGFASLDGPVAGQPRPTVCVVTNEIIGPHKNGGIGTSMTGLAEALAGEGFDVTLLYTGGLWTPDVRLEPWRRRYADLGITLEAIEATDLRYVVGPVRDAGAAAAWLVDRFLRERHFDVVHLTDCCGEAAITVLAKRLGLGFQETLLVVALHSPARWCTTLNRLLPASLSFSAFDYNERLSLGLADVVWSPSRYMLGWAADNGFELPEHTFVQQYSLPSGRVLGGAADAPVDPAPNYGRTEPPRELVFFGRLEERKGLRMFCNAIAALSDRLSQLGVTVTFLGKPGLGAGMPAEDYIAMRSSEWGVPVRVLTDLDQPAAIAYVRQKGRLAVIASPVDNSPCTVYEALTHGIPFLASAGGGVPELVDRADHEQVLFRPDTRTLGDALGRALDEGAWIARPAAAQSDIRDALVTMHEHWRELRSTPVRVEPPTVWVTAVVDHDHDGDLQATLESLGHCPYIHEVRVLDRTGRAAPPGTATIDLTRADPEAAVDELLELVDDHILLIHSGVTLLHEEFSRLLSSLAASGADGLLPAARIRGERPDVYCVPLGGSAAFSLFEGVTFTGALVLRRSVFQSALLRRPLAADAPFLGVADFCVAGGATIWPFPNPSVERPHHPGARTGGASARVEAYATASAVDRAFMLSTGYGAHDGQAGVNRRKALVFAFVDAGLGYPLRVGAKTERGMRLARLAARRRLRALKHRSVGAARSIRLGGADGG